MVHPKAKKKTNNQFKGAGKNLKNLTKGASNALKDKYGKKYRMNTKRANKTINPRKK